MTLSLAFDVAFAVLLVVTIGYAVVLNNKLGNLRRHKQEMERLAATFSQSTARADDSIQRLKGSTEILHKGIEKAQGLRDDLAFLIERGGLAADRLEEGVRGARNGYAAAGPAEPVETISEVIAARRNETDDRDNDKSKAKRDLIEALRQVR